MTEFLIAVIPLLLLVALLLCGRYPGHRVAMRLAQQIASARRTGFVAAHRQCPPLPEAHAVRGGLLIAFRLAQRPPPLVA